MIFNKKLSKRQRGEVAGIVLKEMDERIADFAQCEDCGCVIPKINEVIVKNINGFIASDDNRLYYCHSHKKKYNIVDHYRSPFTTKITSPKYIINNVPCDKNGKIIK